MFAPDLAGVSLKMTDVKDDDGPFREHLESWTNLSALRQPQKLTPQMNMALLQFSSSKNKHLGNIWKSRMINRFPQKPRTLSHLYDKCTDTLLIPSFSRFF